MKTPDDVVAIVRLHELGWGSRRIARELGIARPEFLTKWPIWAHAGGSDAETRSVQGLQGRQISPKSIDTRRVM